MLASPVPIYLGCAALIVGSLGLGAQHMLGGNSVSATSASATNVEAKQPLFARSVEEASLPASHWSSQHSDVAHYEPMVNLLTTPSRSVPPAPVTATPQANPQQASPPPASQPVQPQAIESAQQEPRAAPREIVRDIPQQTRPPKRTRNARSPDDATASSEQVDPRDAYAKADRDSRSQERQRNARQVDTNNERRDGSRRSERRYGNRDESEPVDTRSRSDRRRVEAEEPRQREGERPRSDRRRVEVEEPQQRGGERRVIVREEPEQRVVRGPERRDVGFSPFRLFGIFDR
jgi:hypothetical protein